MARSIAFDRSRAVNRALALFWRKGYQATSLADLLAAMAISRSSFYAAFTDKRSLFIACMDLFSSRTLDMLQRTSADMPPVDALQHFFTGDLNPPHGAGAARRHWGCMLVNTVLEMSGVDDALATRASDHLGDLQNFFQARLEDAGAAPDQAAELAGMLLLLMQGVRVSSRRRLPESDHQQPITTTFRLIRTTLAGAVPKATIRGP